MPENRDALIALAEQLDAARWAANAIYVTAPQADAYGGIADALRKVLTHLAPHPDYISDMEEWLLDGSSVVDVVERAEQDWAGLPEVVYIFDHGRYADTEYARQALLQDLHSAITTEAYSDVDLESEEDREGAINMSFDGTHFQFPYWDNIIAIMQHSPYTLDVKRIMRDDCKPGELQHFEAALV